VGAPLTEAAIQQVRDLIAVGQLAPGAKLPPEAELAEMLGTSRGTVREAVRALVTTRVLDVRRGDGTYVTSLRPELLLEGIGAAAELLQEGFTLELVEVRRILEPAGNETLASLLNGVSSRTSRGRVWRGVIEAGAKERTISEHAGILAALSARDPRVAEAAALLHVSTTEAWFREVVGRGGNGGRAR